MDHTEAIVELKQAVNENFIKKIIPLINKKAETYLGTKGDFGRDVRNVKGYHLGLRTPTDMFYWNFIKSEVERLYFFYKAKFPLMMSTKINQIDLLRYKKGGKYEVMGTDNAELADWINKNLDYDQLILEFYTPGEPNSGWIHCSYTSDQPRKQFLHAYKSEGKTKYKPVIGKAKDLV